MNELIEFWNSMTNRGQWEFGFFIVAMFFYIRHMVVNKDFTPNPLAFGIWLIADVVNYVTYVSFSKYWIGPLIMPVGAFTVVLWGTIKMIRAKYNKELVEKIKFGWKDWSAVIVSIGSLIVYFSTSNGKLSNLMIQLILFMGFVPIVDDLLKTKRVDEPNFTWFLFCIAWGITIVDSSFGYKSWIELLYPLINGGGCAVVLWLSLRNKFLARKN